MSLRSVLVVALALVFGGSAAVGVRSFVGGPAAPNLQKVTVIVAAADIPRGGMITKDMIKTRDYSKDEVPTGAITKTEDAVNRAVFMPLLKDEPLLEGKLAPKGMRGSMSGLTRSGMRAFTITTPSVSSGNAGFVLPGDKVDVLLAMTGDNNDGTGGGSTTTLLQNVEVLAVDQKIDAPAENKVDANQLRSVTLLVTPQDALSLDLGQSRGMLHLSLRNPDDRQRASTRPATVADLRFQQGKPWDERAKGVLEAWSKAWEKRQAGKPAAPAVVVRAPEPPPRLYIRTIRGSQEGAVPVEGVAIGSIRRQPAPARAE